MIFSRAKRDLTEAVDEVFSLDWPFSSGMYGQCYRMAPNKVGATGLVWVTKRPLTSAEQKVLFAHVKTLSKTGIFGELSYGVDPDGVGYVVLPAESPKKLDFDKPGVDEIRRRFIESALAVEQLHARGVAVGTLTHDSFIVEQNDRVRCIEVLGSCSLEAIGEVPLELRIYQPPSGTESRWPSTDLDVRSLAIFGLRLFGATFPPSGIVVADFSTYLTRVMPEAPLWVSHVLEKIVSQPDRVLYRDASELLGAIIGTEKAAQRRGNQGSSGSAGGDDGGVSLDEMVRLMQRKPPRSRFNRLRRMFDPATRRLLAQVGVVCGCLGLAYAAYGWLQDARQSRDDSSAQPTVDMSLLAGSAKSASAPAEPAGRSTGQGASDARSVDSDAAAQGGGALSEFLRAGLASAAGLPEEIRALVGELRDSGLSDSERRQKLLEKESGSPEAVARLAAATVLDHPEMEESLREILIRGVQRLMPGLPPEQAQKFSTPALILAIDLRDELPLPGATRFATRLNNEELWWLLSLHARKRAPKITKTAELALAQTLVPWTRRVFLELIKRSDPSTSPPYEGLVRAAQEEPTASDIEEFSSWYSPLGELALYGVLVSSEHPDRLRGAIDGLVGTPMSSEQAMAPFLEALRGDQSRELVEHARLIGAIGLHKELPPDVFAGLFTREALGKLNSTARRVLVEKSSPFIVQQLLNTAGVDIHPDTLIALLGHHDPGVRKAVIPLLKNLPLASSRDRVQKMYSLERDQSVVQLYQQELGMAEQ